jgi:kynureninase
VIADSTTVNFYKSLRAALNLRPGRRKVVLDRDNFPTNRYVVESLARDLNLELVWLQAEPGGGVTAEDVAAVVDNNTAVVTLSHIAYHSGYLADAKAITDIAHQAGALVVWDLCHSVGSTDIRLDDWDVDFAVGCTYKFVGAGPGAPALIYVNRRHHEHIDQPIWGWLGRKDSFEMEQGFVPAAGVRSMISGTPAVLGILAVREGAAVIAEAGIGAIRAKAVALTEMVVTLTDEWLVPQGFSLGSPRDSNQRGGHVSINRSDAREVCSRLIEAGVLADFRAPETIRIGLSPLPTSFTEVWDSLDVIRKLTA